MKANTSSIVKPQSLGGRLFDKVIGLDSFGQSFSMKLHDGMDKLHTLSGLTFSVLLVLIMMGYTFQKIDILQNRRDFSILSTIKENFYDQDYEINAENGMKIAVAFTAFDNEIEPILDPSIADFVFQRYHWGKHENGTYYTRRDVIPHHSCDENLSLNAFFPVSKGNEELL